MYDQLTIPPQLQRLQRPAMIVGGVGLLLAIGGAIFDLTQFWQSYLLAFLFWLEIGLGCLGFAMLHHLVGGRWSSLIRRIMETGAMTLPLMAMLFLPLLFGLTSLYPWLNSEQVAESALLQEKRAISTCPSSWSAPSSTLRSGSRWRRCSTAGPPPRMPATSRPHRA
ncbi:MAG: hypothetical protein R2867_23695 [Caldilineaceae bacterium]